MSSLTSTAGSPTSDQDHFGASLRRARETRGIALAHVASRTKVARSTLELLEKGDLAVLPTGVYTRGFIRSFARVVGLDETEPLRLYEKALEARAAAEKARSTTPVPVEAPEMLGPGDDDEGAATRRGLGLAVFVIILLLIATLTLSLLLRRPPPSGEGLSLGPAPPAAGCERERAWA